MRACPPIKFGTSGWRARIAEEFTFTNVARVTQAIADYLNANRGEGRPVVVGYDTRFLSPEFAQEAANILAANGLPVLLSKQPVPTPTVAFHIRRLGALAGLNVTASHNPPEYNGIKFSTSEGSPAPPSVTQELEKRIAELPPHLPPLPEGKGGDSLIRMFDPRPAYLAHLRCLVDTRVLRRARLSVVVDVLYGTAAGYLEEFLLGAGGRVEALHAFRDVRFGGQAPEPGEDQLREAVALLRKNRRQAVFGTDGDADRFGVVDRDGRFLTPNEILPLVLDHLVRTRRWKGKVVRSVMTSHFLDAVAKKHGLPVQETPVGFKYIAEAMPQGDFLLGGEESGGLTIRGHVPEKDGILACLLMAEILAVSRKPYRELLHRLQREVGHFLTRRLNFHCEPSLMEALRQHLEAGIPAPLQRLSVQRVDRKDGFKYLLEDGSWLGVRLSGTEPVVRLYLETDSPKKLKALEAAGRKLIGS